MFSRQSWSIERVVTLLTPLFAAGAAWLTALISAKVPGAPRLDPGAIEGIEIAAFLGTVGIVAKWLHGRQIPAIAGIHDSGISEPLPMTLALGEPLKQLDEEAIVNAVLARITAGLATAPSPGPHAPGGPAQTP